MLRMGKLTENFNLPKRSVLTIQDAFKDALRAAEKRQDLRYNDKAVSGEAFINAAVMHFLDKSEAERIAILQEYVPKFESLVDGDVAAWSQRKHPVVIFRELPESAELPADPPIPNPGLVQKVDGVKVDPGTVAPKGKKSRRSPG